MSLFLFISIASVGCVLSCFGSGSGSCSADNSGSGSCSAGNSVPGSCCPSWVIGMLLSVKFSSISFLLLVDTPFILFN